MNTTTIGPLIFFHVCPLSLGYLSIINGKLRKLLFFLSLCFFGGNHKFGVLTTVNLHFFCYGFIFAIFANETNSLNETCANGKDDTHGFVKIKAVNIFEWAN